MSTDSGNSLSTTLAGPQAWRRVVWAITNVFESGTPEGDPAAYQSVDAGIVSFGKHQATLRSGTLDRVVQRYAQLSDAANSRVLIQEYGSRIAARDVTLRHDSRLRQLLVMAASEPEMAQAQDEIFDRDYYQPAVNQARQYRVATPLGLACIYDTLVQGGLFALLPLVTALLGGKVGDAGPSGPIDETGWIRALLDLRQQRLLQLAGQAEIEGNQAHAAALRTSIFRVEELRKLLRNNNLSLAGMITVRGKTIAGIGGQQPRPSLEEPMLSNARYVADVTMPDDTSVAPGHKFIKTWRVRNNGGTRWGTGFELIHTAGAAMSDATRHEIPSVEPGQEVELSIPMTAPQMPGIHFSDWRLKDPLGKQFGDILYVRILVEIASEEAGALICNGRFVADVTIPDDTLMAPGARFTKTWQMANNGDRPWGAGFTLSFIGGTAMTNIISQPLPPAAPGATVDVSVEMWAPLAPGTYFGDWRMKDERGVPFGEVVFLRIKVPTPAGRSLAVPISQRDPLWIEERLGLSNSGKTIGEWGCLLTCLTMVANAFGHPISPIQMNDAMLRRRGFLEPNLTKWNALNNVYGDVVYEGKVPASADILQRINNSLAKGNPVTIQVDFTRDTPYSDNDQHWVLIVGRDGEDYRVNDPWIIPAQEASLLERYGRTGRPLREAIMSAIFYRSTKESKPVVAEVPDVGPPVARVASELQTGMNLNPDAPHSNPVDSDHLKGMDWARYVFKLAAREQVAERNDLNKAFAQYDEMVSRYDRMGVKSLIVLNQETVWGNAPWTGNDAWDAFADQLATVAGQVAEHYRRYGERVAYEIWNEGDLQHNPASVYVKPEQFAIVLKKVAAAIRSVSPDSPLIFGGLATGPEEGIAYLKRCLVAMDGRWPVDAIGIHPYGRWATRAPFDWAQHFGTLGQAFALFQREIPNMPFWITEIGVAADDQIGPENYPAIADYMRDVYRHIGERYLSLVPVVIWFAWSDWMRNAGMVDRDGQRKAHVFDAFRAVRNREL